MPTCAAPPGHGEGDDDADHDPDPGQLRRGQRYHTRVHPVPHPAVEVADSDRACAEGRHLYSTMALAEEEKNVINLKKIWKKTDGQSKVGIANQSRTVTNKTTQGGAGSTYIVICKQNKTEVKSFLNLLR
jgi:hypothetical protein